MLYVYDKNGEYLGIIKNRFLDRQNAYLIAITDSQPNKVIFNENKLKSFLAGLLKIKSGNYEDIFDFPIIINARMGMGIQLYLGEKKIEQLYCDGSLYKF